MSSTENHPGQRRRLFFISLAVFLIIMGITASILKISEIISNLGAVFTILGVLLAVSPQPLPTPRSSAPPDDPPVDVQDQESGYTKIEGVTPTTLGLRKGRGAIVVYSSGQLLGSSINLTCGFDRPDAKPDIVEHIVRRKAGNRPVFVAIFQDLPTGKYTLCSAALGLEEKITIGAREVKEVNCRRRTHRYTAHPRRTNMSQAQSNKEA